MTQTKTNPVSKLSVLMHADIVGSTALVQADELTAHREISNIYQRLDEKVVKYLGRTLEIRGDALVAEFERVSDALCAAHAFQLDESQTATAENKPPPGVRIGISLGEVVIGSGPVTGRGIVIAQRIEQLAPAGGICIQGSAREAMSDRLPFDYDDLGEHILKGIDRPVRVFRSALDVSKPIPEPALPAKINTTAMPANSDSEIPSIAVLPFENLSGDPDHDYFAEGISEDISTSLSQFRSITVVSRLSSFTFRDRTESDDDIGEKLHVRYLLKGTVRRSGSRFRITVKLIDLEISQDVWSERYDREMEDIFDVQDDVAKTVCSTLAGQIETLAFERARTKHASDLNAYDYLLRGLDLYKTNSRTPERVKEAVVMFDKARTIQPDLARAHAWHSCALASSTPRLNDEFISNNLRQVQKALELDPNESEAHRIAAAIYMHQRIFDKMKHHAERALYLNPNDAHIKVKCGDMFSYLGDGPQAKTLALEAMRLNPYHPGWYWQSLGLAEYVSGDFEQAIASFRKVNEPTQIGLVYECAARVAIGDMDGATNAARELMKIAGDIGIGYYAENKPFALHKERKMTEDLCSRLSEAGVPQ